MDTIGTRITHAREAKGYSAKKLADLIGVKQDTLAAWEADERDPRANRLLRLSGALNVSFAWLIVGDEYDEGSVAPTRSVGLQAKILRMKQLHLEFGEIISSLEEDASIMVAQDEHLEELADIEENL